MLRKISFIFIFMLLVIGLCSAETLVSKENVKFDSNIVKLFNSIEKQETFSLDEFDSGLREVYNTINGCSLSSNTITLSAGTYIFSGWQFFHRAASFRGRIRVRDITNNVSLLGESGYGNDQIFINIYSKPYIITSNADFQFQYYLDAGKATDGLGVAVGSGENNVFASLIIEKVA